MKELQTSIKKLTTHSAQCGGTCKIEGERMHSGLAVILQAVCTKCSKIFSICSSPRVDTSNGKKWTVNLGAVLAQMSTRGGLTRLNTTLAHLDVPGMQKRMYSQLEEFLGIEMMRQLGTSMQEVAEEEKANAVMKNRYHQRVPAITVVVDGGWSKHSHKHSYNAKSGVAWTSYQETTILGHSKQILFCLCHSAQ